jgi:hypothetical protein
LIILKAHALAGRPTPGCPLGSFESWDRVVRAAVWFATDGDCLTTQRPDRRRRSRAPREDRPPRGLEGAPRGQGGGGGVTTAEAVAMVDDPANRDRYHGLRGALLNKGKAGNWRLPRAWGPCSEDEEHPRRGLRFKESGKRHGAVCWVVESTRPIRGEVGEVGEDTSNPNAGGPDSESDTIKSGRMRNAPEDGQSESSPSSPTSPHVGRPGEGRNLDQGGVREHYRGRLADLEELRPRSRIACLARATMTAAVAILDRALRLGVRVEPNGSKLRYQAPDELPDADLADLLIDLAEHKAAILDALAQPRPSREESVITSQVPHPRPLRTAAPPNSRPGASPAASAGAAGTRPWSWRACHGPRVSVGRSMT